MWKNDSQPNDPTNSGSHSAKSDAESSKPVAQPNDPTNSDSHSAKSDAESSKPGEDDRFDPANLGLEQDFAGLSHVKSKWDTIKVEKPSKARVFRVHPTLCLVTVLLNLKEENEVYLVPRELRAALAEESLCSTYRLFFCVTKAGTPFVWPIKTEDPDGKWNVWHQSAYQIAKQATTRWALMQANRDAGYYVADFDMRPPELQQQPTWPELTLQDWLRLAFRGFMIDRLDHPVLRRLRMED